MAFWGVEVKPGKPITHTCDQARGRLRISQATLGFGEASMKSVVQCNVGDRSPVLLCVLLPGQTESSHLDLEFEEADDVVFSVLGPRSVYLTGYYVRQNHRSNSRSDTESYGVDIENTQSDGSNFNSDDDKYDDSFVNDEELQFSPGEKELQFSPGSPALCIDEGLDEVTPWKARKGRGKLLKKKRMVIESDSDVNSPKKEDEDGFSLSLQEVLKDLKTHTCDIGEKVAKETVEMDDEANDDGVYGSETKQNANPLDISDKIERVTQSPLDEEGTEVNNVKNELPKQVGSSEKMVSSQEEIHGSNTSEAPINQNLPMINGEDQMQSLDLAKPKNKRKECPLTDKTSEVQTDNEDPSVPRWLKELEIDSSANLAVGEDHMVAPELELENGQKSKKRRNELLEGELTQVTDEKIQDFTEENFSKQDSLHAGGETEHLPDHMVAPEFDLENDQKSKKSRNELLEGELTLGTDEKIQDITEDNLLKQDSLHADGMTEHLPVASGEYEQQKSEETRMENFGLECQNAQKEDEVIQEAANGENQKDQIDSNIGTISEFQASDNQLGKKIKKKRKKTRGNKDLNMSAIQMSGNQEDEDQSAKTVPKHSRTLSNGLTIEELESGPQGGKVAVPGKTVKICYTGLLDNGHVFDSNAVCKFRLGDEEYIDGWNIGIDGMHVGDKRRLIIPPSMGFGEDGAGENVPPNSWLIYDIELISVRR